MGFMLKTNSARWAFFGPKSQFGLFSGPWAFYIFRKKAHKIWLFGAFLKVDRKLLKFYLQNTNFNMFFIYC